MPSLIDLLKGSKKKRGSSSDTSKLQIAQAQAGSVEDGKDGTKSQRQSLFRGMLRKSRSEDLPLLEPSRSNPKPVTTQEQFASSFTIEEEKPLPPPPASQTPPPETAPTPLPAEVEGDVKPEQPLLTAEDIQKIFSGAPQFFVRSEGYHAGPPHPSVAFPWDLDLEIRDLTDHAQLQNSAWGCVTTTPHIIRNQRYQTVAGIDDRKHLNRAKFVPRAKERPNMLSMQGLERGTVGFQAAFEIAVADALHDNEKELSARTKQKIRNKFLKNKNHGLRRLDEAAVLKRLVEISDIYNTDKPPSRTTVDMYTELFTRLLNPPTRVVNAADPYGFHVQIEALVNVLTAPDIWVDFSNVEWRIRLGQILWSPAVQPDIEDGDKNDTEKPETQRYWLLLQILLSCELVIRLDAVTLNAQTNPKLITMEATHRFEKNCTRPVKWSLLLARLWLENIRINVPLVEMDKPKPTSSWLAPIKSFVAGEKIVHHSKIDGTPEFYGRYQDRQINGLVHFARKLRWPESDDLAEKFSHQGAEKERVSESSKTTIAGGTLVVGTPLSMTNQRSSYFVGAGRPGIRHGVSHNKMSSLFYPAGWLSKSYLSGLVLPGEGLSHFLMSTLLENDEIAVASLGEDANLYGGFVFKNRTYWSTACIIGRVLAAGKDVSECINWLTSPVTPEGMTDGWVNVQVELEPRSDGKGGPHSARIWQKHLVEKESYVLGDGDAKTLSPEDFTLPPSHLVDADILDVKLLRLNLHPGSETTTPSERETSGTDNTCEPHEIRTFIAEMVFTFHSEKEIKKEMGLSLTYDVQFVTAHPCVPSIHSNIIADALQLELATSTSKADLQARLRRPSGPHTLFMGHALHKSYHFSRHTLTSVIYASPDSPPPLLSLHTDSKEVFVIDCCEPSPPEAAVLEAHPAQSAYVARKRRFGSDLEMLARAWCAEKGYNALISRRGRNCIACSIREARALSWKIVLRFG